MVFWRPGDYHLDCELEFHPLMRAGISCACGSEPARSTSIFKANCGEWATVEMTGPTRCVCRCMYTYVHVCVCKCVCCKLRVEPIREGIFFSHCQTLKEEQKRISSPIMGFGVTVKAELCQTVGMSHFCSFINSFILRLWHDMDDRKRVPLLYIPPTSLPLTSSSFHILWGETTDHLNSLSLSRETICFCLGFFLNFFACHSCKCHIVRHAPVVVINSVVILVWTQSQWVFPSNFCPLTQPSSSFSW